MTLFIWTLLHSNLQTVNFQFGFHVKFRNKKQHKLFWIRFRIATTPSPPLDNTDSHQLLHHVLTFTCGCTLRSISLCHLTILTHTPPPTGTPPPVVTRSNLGGTGWGREHNGLCNCQNPFGFLFARRWAVASVSLNQEICEDKHESHQKIINNNWIKKLRKH